MRKTIEVVDGFYRDPETWRSRARQATFVAGDDGTRTRAAFSSEEAIVKIAEILGKRPESEADDADFGYFATLSAASDDDHVPHQDSIGWVGIVSLATEHSGAWVSFHADGTNDPAGETLRIPMDPNRLVLFRADRLFHRVSPLAEAEAEAVTETDADTDRRLVQVFRFPERP